MRDEPNTLTMLALVLLAILSGGCITRASRPAPSQQPQTRPESVVTWWDPVEWAWWVVGDRVVTYSDAADACTGKYRLPTADELKLVRTRGICTGRAVCPVVWAQSVDRRDAIVIDLAGGETRVARKSDEAAVAFCVEALDE